MVIIFQFHKRLADTFTGDGTVLRAANRGRQGGVGVGVFKRAHGKLDAQDPPHGVINSILGDQLRRHQILEILDEFHVVVAITGTVGDHHHVHPGVDGTLHIGFKVR